MNVLKTTIVSLDLHNVVKSPNNNSTTITIKNMKPDDCAIYCIRNNISQNVAIINFIPDRRDDIDQGYAAKMSEDRYLAKTKIPKDYDLSKTMPQLDQSLSQSKHSFDQKNHITDVLITRDVKLTKNNINYKVNVVSVASKRKYETTDFIKRMRYSLINVYTVVHKYLPDVNTLIFEPWTCGPHDCDYGQMAELMNDTSTVYGGYLKNIVYAIPKEKSREFQSTMYDPKKLNIFENNIECRATNDFKYVVLFFCIMTVLILFHYRKKINYTSV